MKPKYKDLSVIEDKKLKIYYLQMQLVLIPMEICLGRLLKIMKYLIAILVTAIVIFSLFITYINNNNGKFEISEIECKDGI